MSKVTKEEIQSFVKAWSNQGHEVADKVTFWNAILKFLGVPQEQIDNHSFIQYEKSIKLKQNEHFTGSIDAYIPSTKVLIEQKSSGVDLSKPEDRPNGGHTEKIKPFDQARRYDNHLSANEHANYYVLCNFDQIVIYDIRKSVDAKPTTIELKDLERNLSSLDFLVDKNIIHISKQQQLSVDAGKLVSKMYDELLNIFSNYPSLDKEKVTHSINKLCVRLVFCLYAEDAGLFNSTTAFYDYFKDVEPNKIGLKLKELFRVLNTKEDNRNTKKDPFWKDEHPRLEAFPYVNGGLFADQDVIIPPFTAKLKDILLNQASRGFNWKDINPTIFGAVFESTLNPETRRQGGMHYTSVENIHKVIDPLFLDDLKNELNEIKKTKQPASLKRKAQAFQEKLANITFFDPACGSGNFLTETYLQLRKLENEAIKLIYPNPELDVGQAKDIIKVSIQQFHGIEINDFAVSVAKTALWIAESQMWEETKDIFFADWHFLPLKTYTHIHEGNALRMNWNQIIENYGCDYIISNPPFVGSSRMNEEQKKDMANLPPEIKHAKRLDYVTAWYIKASQYITSAKTKCAFVSTDSIIQGTQVPDLWSFLLGKSINIDFAYRSFEWNNDTKNGAHVYCVIIGFHFYKSRKQKEKVIFDENNQEHKVNNINPYLTDGSNTFVTERFTPLSKDAPKMLRGNTPTDGGGLLLNQQQYEEIKLKDKIAFKYIKRYMMGREFLNNINRYCLWLVNATPSDLHQSPYLQKHIQVVKNFRINSKSKSSQRMAVYPYLFLTRIKTGKHFIALPKVSSEKREYLPIGFLDDSIIPGDKLFVVPNASLYDFGLLESKVHTAWNRTLCGRLGESFSYSNTIVYNNFPFPNVTVKQKEKIEKTAQGILDARRVYPNSSLADLYDPLNMPIELRRAQQANDKAVSEAYGLPAKATESEVVTHLFKMYEKLTRKK